jgi:hypothetical protein
MPEITNDKPVKLRCVSSADRGAEGVRSADHPAHEAGGDADRGAAAILARRSAGRLVNFVCK